MLRSWRAVLERAGWCGLTPWWHRCLHVVTRIPVSQVVDPYSGPSSAHEVATFVGLNKLHEVTIITYRNVCIIKCLVDDRIYSNSEQANVNLIVAKTARNELHTNDEVKTKTQPPPCHIRLPPLVQQLQLLPAPAPACDVHVQLPATLVRPRQFWDKNLDFISKDHRKHFDSFFSSPSQGGGSIIKQTHAVYTFLPDTTYGTARVCESLLLKGFCGRCQHSFFN